jgi:hypothetical protein
VGQARVREIRYRIDVNTLAHQPAGELRLNEIGVIAVEAQRPLFFDAYAKNRATGSFILIDPITNETLGAGMIRQPQQTGVRTGRVTTTEREAARGHAALAICLPEGSLELAWALERRLFDSGYAVHVLPEVENLEVALRTLLDAGLIAIVTPESSEVRERVRRTAPARQFAWVEPVSTDPDAGAREIVQALESAGRLGRSQGPLTGGAGI